MHRFRTDGFANVRPAASLPPISNPDSRELETTEYQSWKGRVVSAFASLTRGVRRLLFGRPSAARAIGLYDSFRKEAWNRIPDEFHRNIKDYEIACVMHLHRIGQVKRTTVDGQKHEVLTGGARPIRRNMLDSIKADVALSTTELAYRFLSEDRSLPAGFLERALIPHFVDTIVQNYGVNRAEAEGITADIADSQGLLRDCDITFERILEVKNRIRWHFNDQPGSERAQMDYPDHSAGLMKYDRANPAATPPGLERPGFSRYELDKEDKKFIRTVVDNGKGIKIPRHDLLNRVKRKVLRNKKEGLISALGTLFSTFFLGTGTGGMAAVLNILYCVGYYSLWSGITDAVRMVRALRAIQQAQLSGDFRFDGTEFNFISEMDEKKFRVFMRSLRYVCSQETLARIYNAYAELEKDAEARLAMTPNAHSLDDVIKLEEGKARYLHRRENVRKAFRLYDVLYTTATADLARMEREWEVCVNDLWNTKFSRMNPARREAIFNRAANDPRVTEKTFHLVTNKTGWLQSIFPQLSRKGGVPAAQRDQALEEYQRIIDQEMPELMSDNAEREMLNRHAEHAATAGLIAKDGVGIYMNKLMRDAVNTTVVHGVKLGWSGIRGTPKLVLTPYLPRPSFEGLATFCFFFSLDFILEQVNSRINKRRLGAIQRGEKQSTGFGPWRRYRTGREEVNTMRRLSKDNLPGFVEKVLKLHSYHKELMEELKFQKELSDGNPYARPYEYMDEDEAAVMILKRKKYEFWVREMMAGAIGELHRSIQTKTEYWDNKLGDIIAGE